MENPMIWGLYALVASALWGATYSIDYVLLNKVTPLTLLFLGSLVGAFVTAGCISVGQGWVFTLEQISNAPLWLTLSSVVVGTLASLMILISLATAPSPAVAAIVEISYPIFTLLFAAILFGISPVINPKFVLGSVFLITGTFFVIYSQT